MPARKSADSPGGDAVHSVVQEGDHVGFPGLWAVARPWVWPACGTTHTCTVAGDADWNQRAAVGSPTSTICVERHQRASTVVTSNRTAEEWLSMMSDPLLAQSAVDRLVSTSHELIIEGESYRCRQKPSISHASGASVDEEKRDHHDHS